MERFLKCISHFRPLKIIQFDLILYFVYARFYEEVRSDWRANYEKEYILCIFIYTFFEKLSIVVD